MLCLQCLVTYRQIGNRIGVKFLIMAIHSFFILFYSVFVVLLRRHSKGSSFRLFNSIRK